MRYSHHPMARAGQDDERTGDEPEGIHYFDFSDPFGAAEDDADPFASESPTRKENLRGDADAAGEPVGAMPKSARPVREEDPCPSRDVFEFALTDLSASSTALSAADAGAKEQAQGPSTAFVTLTSFFEAESPRSEPRAQFVAAFDAARADTGRPFLAVALRMPADVPAAARFPLVEQAIRSAMQSDDALLVDFERLRLVAVLRGRGADDARPLFAHLMATLREHAPNAEDVGHHVAALAAPDGRPFRHGTDFLAAAYDAP